MKMNLKNLIKLILDYAVLFILVNLLFDPFFNRFTYGYNAQAMLTWAIGIPFAITLIYLIIKK